MPPDMNDWLKQHHLTTGWRRPAGSESLPEVHRSIHVPSNAPFLKKMAAFAGPGFLIAVGYMDPGNWATDLDRPRDRGSPDGLRLVRRMWTRHLVLG